jgi:DNA-binding transcriptional MocR family regulator
VLAESLGVSPGTIVSAYDTLKTRGYLIGKGRNGTVVQYAPASAQKVKVTLPDGAKDLSSGNPDRDLLPDFGEVLKEIDTSPRLYDESYNLEELVLWCKESFRKDGIHTDSICVTSGALDAITRVLEEHLKPGDRVAVEDPCFTGVLDILHSRSLVPVPVEIDGQGMKPESLQQAISQGVQAVIVTPRAQNPTGAALSEERARDLRRVLKSHSDILLIEDDHAGPVSGAACQSLVTKQTTHWAVVRSVSKSLGPDLRLAYVASDPTTMARLEARQYVGVRWVSKVLQQLVLGLLKSKKCARLIKKTQATYEQRRKALQQALQTSGISSIGCSGYNLWIPVNEEAKVCQALMAQGWCVSPGAEFRLESKPGIRVTFSTLLPNQAVEFASALSECLAPQGRQAVYTGRQ